MSFSMKTSARKSCAPSSEIIRGALMGILIGAVIMGLYYGGKAAGRMEVLSSDMWTDSCGIIYIDSGTVTAHENLARYVRK